MNELKPASWRASIGELSLVVLAATALAIVLTYPLPFRLDSLGRVNTDDGRWSIWVVSWVAHALTTNPFQLLNANIFYPHKLTLAFSEANVGAGLIGAPVWALSKNPYLTHNVVIIISFIAAYAGAYYLIRYLTRSRAAALVAGVLFAFCPLIFARTAHIQLMLTGGLPFCLLALHRIVDRPTVGRSVGLGLLIWLQALACGYYGVFAVLMVGLGTLFFAYTRSLWRSRDYWVGVALAAFVSIALTLPLFLPYVYLQQELGFVRTLDHARQYSANVGAWLASPAWAHRWFLPAPGNYNKVLFPGGITLVFGMIGVWRLTRTITPSFVERHLHPFALPRDIALFYLLIATIAFWSSFGPDAGLYWLLYKTVPFFTFIGAPARIGILVVLALVVLAAPVLASLLGRSRRPMLAATAVAVIASAELASVPLTQFREAEPMSVVYRMLATLPRGAVIELPYWHERRDFPRHATYMLNSTAHWMPLVNGYSDHIPQDFRDTVKPLNSFPTRQSFEVLAHVNARYVIFHMDLYETPARERLMQRLETYSPYLALLGRDDYVWLYEIVDWPHQPRAESWDGSDAAHAAVR